MSSVTENNNTYFHQEKFPANVSENDIYLQSNNYSSLVSIESINNNNNKINSNKNINDIWTKDHFNKKKIQTDGTELSTSNTNIIKTWASQESESKDEVLEDTDETVGCNKKEFLSNPSTPEKETTSPSHHARRPMNAFLIFCKKHRPIVRLKFPNLENRGITRILGEWWAMLDTSDKSAYTSLAKEYKDAFFSANPDFKWYKLPAPPLRTLSTRPNTTLPPKTSPTVNSTQPTSTRAEFTPGKLADESQLGSLTSLLSPNNIVKPENATFVYKTENCTTVSPQTIPDTDIENKDHEHQSETTPKSSVKMLNNNVPPKKRLSENFNNYNTKSVVRDIFFTKMPSNVQETNNDNVTKQDLMNKVVDSIFSDKNEAGDEEDASNKDTEPRKSIRSCKGRRYAEFMVEGKLFGNKHLKKVFSQEKFNAIVKNESSKSQFFQKSLKSNVMGFDLEDTIKRLAERTNKKVVYKSDVKEEKVEEDRPQSSQSDISEEGNSSSQSYFDLDLKISELPSLSYEAFLQRKRANKKRKPIRHKVEDAETKSKDTTVIAPKNDDNSLVGSKKRKNKSSIIRLESRIEPTIVTQFNNDLSGLATLAEIAAITEKIN